MKKNLPSFRNLFLISAMILGMLAPRGAEIFSPFLIYVLAFMMSLSLQQLSLTVFRPKPSIIRPILKGIFLNYFLFALISLPLVALFFSAKSMIFAGFVLIAISPPGVVIIPMMARMNFNINDAAIGTIGAYFFLILLFPSVMFFYGINADVMEMFWLLFYSVIVPIVASRIIRRLPIKSFTFKYQGLMIDISFFILIYVVIGMNQSFLINQYLDMIMPILVLFIALFVFTLFYMAQMHKRRIGDDLVAGNNLLYSIKNNGFSAVSAFTLFGAEAAIPSAALSVVLLVYIIVFPWLFGKSKRIGVLMSTKSI